MLNQGNKLEMVQRLLLTSC